jgi:hypothetical protein
MKKVVKRLLFGGGIQEKSIRFGLASGLKMKISFDDKLQRYLGLDENEIQRCFKKFSAQAGIFVDIGASDGYYGLIYRKLNNEGVLYLCDANASFAEQQMNNFKLNGFGLNSVNIVSKFIADYNDDNHVALDTLIDKIQGTVFIKIDVDGGELHVLKGVEKTLTRNNCKVIVETHSKELEENCIKYLENIGYKTNIIPNAWWRLIVPEQRPIPHNRWFSAEKNNKKSI